MAVDVVLSFTYEQLPFIKARTEIRKGAIQTGDSPQHSRMGGTRLGCLWRQCPWETSPPMRRQQSLAELF